MFLAPTSSRARALRTAVGVSTLLLVAGCGGDDGTSIPDARSSGSPAATSTWSAEQQAVVDGMTAYNDTVASFLQGAALDMDRMRGVAAGRYARRSAKEISITQSAGFVMSGKDEYAVRKVSISRDTATVSACWDSSTSTVVKENEKPPATVSPLPRTMTRFTMVKSDHGWLVTGRRTGARC